MNFKKFLIFGLIASFAIGIGTSSASAFLGPREGRGEKMFQKDLSTLTEEQKEERYERIVEKLGDKVSDEQKVQLQQAFESNDHDTIKSIMDPIKDSLKADHKKRHEDIKSAIESNNYESFLSLVKGTPMEEKIDSQEKFNLLVEMHTLKTRIDEIKEELDITHPYDKKRGMHHGEKRKGMHMFQENEE
jgi:hypothetical protein